MICILIVPCDSVFHLYGLTEEGLDFIINYDIKYRMGDERFEAARADQVHLFCRALGKTSAAQL